MDHRLIRACRRQSVDVTPVWFMRQAGRFLPEYRKIRETHDIISICKNPELCAKVTTLPVEILGVDAAIMFADIMLPIEGMGVRFEIQEGVGPIIKQPISDLRSAASLETLDPASDVPFVLEAIGITRKMLDAKVPLIGFCGAPFTIASYLIEGRPTRDFIKVKTLMYRDPKAWHALMGKLSDSMVRYLRSQVNAGVELVQLFDSWVGCLSPQDYHNYVLPYSQRIFKELEDTGVPRIHFGTGTASLLEEMKAAGGDVFGVDWRIPLDVAWERLGDDVGILGNLDPATLVGDMELVKSASMDILRRAGGRRGHIFNLGHGMLPDASPENVAALVKFIHDTTSNSASQHPTQPR
ncbi:MAG TPA: uroporphyrinogen decarboxylase [Candidatus Acidoferrales bacterium]|nr:uroporphyrinogen decarboxylase [Candidatus Acidoferrales bacterium]